MHNLMIPREVDKIHDCGKIINVFNLGFSTENSICDVNKFIL